MALTQRVRRARAMAAVAMVLLCAPRGRAAEPVFVVSQPLTHVVSPRGGDAFRLIVSSAKQVTSPRVLVAHVRSPRGELLPHEVVTIEQPTAPIDPAGTFFGVRIADVGRFKASGDYTVTLRLSGTVAKTVHSELVPLTLQVPVPVLNLDKLQNLTVPVERWFPWSRPVARHRIVIDETGGRANVHDLKVAAQDVFVKGTTERAGAVLVRVVDATNGADGTGRTLPAGEQREVVLEISGVNRAGALATSLLIASPSLAAAATLPLTLQVADRWPMPLFVITLGVVLGAWVRYLSQVARPREVARVKSVFIAGHVARWRERSRDPQQIQLLDEIDDLLRVSEERLQVGNAAGAETALNDAETKLADFRKAWDERFQGLIKRVQETAAGLDALQVEIPDTDTDDLARLDSARRLVAGARQSLGIFDLEAAESQLAAAAITLEQLRAAHPPDAAVRGLAPARRGPELDIEVAEGPGARIAGRVLSFQLLDLDGAILPDDEIEWDFGEGPRLTAPPGRVTHHFRRQGAFRVRAAIKRNGQDVLAAATDVQILPHPIEPLVIERTTRLRGLELGLTFVSIVLAILTCMGLLFFGRVFGTPSQYVEAFLWGFGIDSGVKNVADLLKKV